MGSHPRPDRTESRSGRPLANSRAELNQRTRVAQVAARLIAEGLNDYEAAKRKAARQLGLSGSIAMPDDAEVEGALRQHQSLFGNPVQSEMVRKLQGVALEALAHLAQFSPWLVGPVLSGAATVHSDIEIEMVGVEPKVFEMHLLSRALPFTLSPIPHTRQDLATRYVINFDQHSIRCTVFPTEAARRAAMSRRNRSMERAQLPEARARFARQEATPS